MHEVTLVEVPTQLVLGVQRRGHYGEIPIALGEIVEYAMSHGAQLVGMPIALMHELGKDAAEKADREGTAVIDVAFPVSGPVQGSESVKCYELPGGTMAKVIHKGPYEACETAYNALFAWIAANGYMVSDPTREVYLNDPRTVKPEDILTEIYAPVVKV
jgi:effector-binding domain-containing protein